MSKCITEEIIDYFECGYKLEDIAQITGYEISWIRRIKEQYERSKE